MNDANDPYRNKICFKVIESICEAGDGRKAT